MTPDDAIDAAQEALSRNDPAFASELYESAARALLGSDEKRAVYLLKLASSYAHLGDPRQDELAAEAQQILERIGDHDDEIADLILGRAAVAEQGGQLGRARRLYVECVRRLAKNLADAAVSHLAGDYESASFGEKLQLASEKIRYCSDRVTELEGGHD
jgi:hypothetical protein